MYRKKAQSLRGIPRGLAKRPLTSPTTSSHAHNSHCWRRTAQQIATTTVQQRTPAIPEQQELQQAEAKLLYKAVKRETPTTEYYKAAETEKRLEHNGNPRHTPAETTELTEHRSDQERDQSLKTSTNIPDLHEVREGQPCATTRDTKQPCEKQRLTIGTATLDLHKVEGPQAEPPCTSDTPRGQGTTHSGATTDDTKERVTETAVECQHMTP
ncbi:hypothetical protein Taro_018404 [Colocasia esculenta]|uniref:Uncharacterized protein n=1 Tax=Colocasia esculenta TaxID=4460 RepID=A0A843UQN4_COLES|nr:hypothetical protein [Colocasia esculenta]